MNWEIWCCFLLLALAVWLFATEKIPVDVITLLLLSLLIILRILSPEEAFAGFSNDSLIILGSIFVMGGALQQVGVLEGLANWVLRIAGKKERKLNALLMLLCGSISSFMNNTTVVAMFAPQASLLAQRAGFSPSRLLMPLAFATILGGTCTLIGTSTNIAVSGYLKKEGMPPLGLFEVAPVGVICTLVGIGYLLVAGPYLLPGTGKIKTAQIDEAQHRVSDATVIPIEPSEEIQSSAHSEGSLPPDLRNRILAPLLFLLSLAVGTIGWIPMSASLLSGAVLVILCGCISADQARNFIDWRLLILIGGMTAFGKAMENSGAADWLAVSMVTLTEPWGIKAVLAGFLLLTILLTQPMSNAAAALVVIPVAMRAALHVDAEPRTFAVGVMLAASLSFITPLEPACILVYGPGKYSFRDFVKVGAILTLLLMIVVMLILPLFFPLQATS